MTDSLGILARRMAALAPPPPVALQAAPPPPLVPLTLTIAQAAHLVGVHPKTIRKWPLPWIVEGRTVRVTRADFYEYLRRRGGGTLPRN